MPFKNHLHVHQRLADAQWEIHIFSSKFEGCACVGSESIRRGWWLRHVEGRDEPEPAKENLPTDQSVNHK